MVQEIIIPQFQSVSSFNTITRLLYKHKHRIIYLLAVMLHTLR